MCQPRRHLSQMHTRTVCLLYRKRWIAEKNSEPTESATEA